jgi:hypothetical protein
VCVSLSIDFEKERTGHGISDLSYFGLFWPSLLQCLPRHITFDPINQFLKSLWF